MTWRPVRPALLVLLGLLLGCWLTWWHPLPRVAAQGVGFFGTSTTGTRTNCTQITSPIMGQTTCLEQSQNVIKVWDANVATWTQAGSGGGYTLPNGVSYTINNFFNANATGTQNQYAIAASITGTNLGGTVAKIAIGGHAQSGGGGTASNQVEGLNLVCQQNSGDARVDVVCAEINVNTNGGDDALDPGRGHYGVSLVNSGGNISGPAALFISSSSGAANPWQRGVLVATASIANGGFSFHARGDGTNGPFTVSTDSIVNVGQNIRTGITAPAIGLANNRYLFGLNAAGTSHQPLIGLSNTNTVTIDLNGNGAVFGNGFSAAGGIALPSGVTGGNKGTGTINHASSSYYNGAEVIRSGVAPACTNNCGTSPSVTGRDSAFRVTMGSTGTPRSPFLVMFSATWPTTPSCIAQLTTATTTTVSVTNATTTGVTVNTVIGPAQGDVYAIHCLGVG